MFHLHQIAAAKNSRRLHGAEFTAYGRPIGLLTISRQPGALRHSELTRALETSAREIKEVPLMSIRI